MSDRRMTLDRLRAMADDARAETHAVDALPQVPGRGNLLQESGQLQEQLGSSTLRLGITITSAAGKGSQGRPAFTATVTASDGRKAEVIVGGDGEPIRHGKPDALFDVARAEIKKLVGQALSRYGHALGR